MGAGVEPSIAAAHGHDAQLIGSEGHLQRVGDLELCAGGGFDLFRPLRAVLSTKCGAVDEIEPGDGVVGGWDLGLLDDVAHAAISIEINHAITFGIGHAKAKDGSAAIVAVGPRHQLQVVAEEDVVAQHQSRRAPGQEILSQNEGLRQPVRRGLHDIGERQAPLAADAEGIRGEQSS